MTGELLVVGLGPGDPALLTGQARAALASAAVLVGYSGYLDLVRAWRPDADFRPSPIGAERARAHEAVALAAAGQRVALVSSGDAGVYGMAGLALEEWARLSPAERPAFAVLPGVTALLAAGALLGAPLGADFAAISLSDLLTPWSTIERRLDAAAAADFVLALYNPASGARRWQLPAACALIGRHRAPDTPVGVARNVGRPEQAVALLTLAELPTWPVDMLSIAIVGGSTTRRLGDYLLTPRGYHEA